MAQANTSSVAGNNKSQYSISIGIIGILFFIFGFVTWLNGTLIPFLKTACELNSFQALFVTFAFYISYFVMAIPSSWVLKKTGLKEGMSLGLLIMAIGALIFIPAAYTRIYGLFLTGLFVQGTGLAILQTASNPYITILGPKESAAARISIMGIANKVAGLLSPVILTYLVLHNMDRFSEAHLKALTPLQKADVLNELAARIVWPYVVIAIALVALAAFVKYSPLPEVEAEEDEVAISEEHHAKKNIFQFPQLILGVFTLFLYVGVEVLAGDTIGLFGKSLNISFFGRLTSYTMCAMVIGYIIGILTIPKYI
ncbi:MAG: MFS transporter, partial [Bacteroidota bacterium]|nr:MFS transporter [Bacteroidota bacterium]